MPGMAQPKTEKILTAALQVFAEHGFEKATVDEIAFKAGVAKGTVFYHYKSKDELFFQLIERGVGLLVDTLQSEIVNLPSPAERLRRVIKTQTTLSYAHPEFFTILQSEVWGKLERQQVLRKALRRYLELIDSIVQAGIGNGDFIHADPENLASAIFGMTSATVLYLMLTKKEKSPNQVVEDLQNCLLHGILK